MPAKGAATTTILSPKARAKKLSNKRRPKQIAAAEVGPSPASAIEVAVTSRADGTAVEDEAPIRRTHEKAQQVASEPASLQRAPAAAGPKIEAPKAEDLIAAKYPHLTGILDARQLKTIQRYIDWRVQNQRVRGEVEAYDKKALEQGRREGYDDPRNVRFLGSYHEGLERIESKFKDAPEDLTIEVDTRKLLDRAILEEQPWNVAAEKEFRERWVLKLASKPTMLDLGGEHSLEQVFRAFFWGNETFLPNEGGLVTWPKLMEIEAADRDYSENVRNGPFVKAVREAYDKSLRPTFNFYGRVFRRGG